MFNVYVKIISFELSKKGKKNLDPKSDGPILGSTQKVMLDLGGTNPLSFHCQEREVIAAL